MIKPIQDNRRKNAAKGKMPAPKPEWIEAVLIMLLHKTAILQEKIDGKPGVKAHLTISIADLERFEKLKTNNKTQISFDHGNKSITITAPEAKLPDKTAKVETEIITEI